MSTSLNGARLQEAAASVSEEERHAADCTIERDTNLESGLATNFLAAPNLHNLHDSNTRDEQHGRERNEPADGLAPGRVHVVLVLDTRVLRQAEQEDHLARIGPTEARSLQSDEYIVCGHIAISRVITSLRGGSPKVGHWGGGGPSLLPSPPPPESRHAGWVITGDLDYLEVGAWTYVRILMG